MKIESESLTYAEAGWNRPWSFASETQETRERPSSADGCGSGHQSWIAKRLTVHDRGRLHHATLSYIPDGTLALTLDDAVATPPHVLSAVLSEAAQTADRSPVRYLRFLDTEGISDAQSSCFNDAGFQALARLDQLVHSSDDGPAPVATPDKEFAVQKFSLQYGPTDEAVTLRALNEQSNPTIQSISRETDSVCDLLEKINRTTCDLKQLPKASAAQLIRTWALLRLNVVLYLAGDNECSQGVAVVSWSDADWQSSVTLEFIGVLPSARRNGIASRILKQLLSDVHPASLSAIVDAENHPAVSFYQRHGFQSAASFSLWCRSPDNSG